MTQAEERRAREVEEIRAAGRATARRLLEEHGPPPEDVVARVVAIRDRVIAGMTSPPARSG